jgi:hypothetical protein
MPEKHLDFLEDYCLNCHDTPSSKGDVDLETLTFDVGADIVSAELWQKVLNAINAGEMPPEKKKQPTPLEKAGFLEALSARLVTARQILTDTGGVITMRRLNRREYTNTIRDLLGVEVDASALPNDSNSDGFDTSGSSLFFSSDQFENYLAIARQALDSAIVTGPRPEKQIVRVQAEIAGKRYFQNRYDQELDKHNRFLAWKNSNGRPPTDFGYNDYALAERAEKQYQDRHFSYKFILDNPLIEKGALLGHVLAAPYAPRTSPPNDAPPGNYILRARVAHLNTKHIIPNTHDYLVFGETGLMPDSQELLLAGARRITGTIEQPQTVEFPIALTEHGPRDFTLRMRMPNNKKAIRDIFKEFDRELKRGPDPSLWIDWIEWEGPIVEQWPPAAHQALFFRGEGTDESDEYARAIIERFGARAFRTRKPSPAFVDRLMDFYRERRGAGDSFTEALKEPLSILLASPGFIYLAEPTGEPGSEPQKPGKLSPKELAVRLAYFLWSAPPDAELLELARRGKLANKKTLRAQTDRLINDPRATAFIEGFTYQWLTLERLDFFQFNTHLYPTFDHTVREAARQEIYYTVRHLLLEDRPLGQLLKADYVMVNELLADYYGIPGVSGHGFRPVPVPTGMPRGGLLGTAAVLAMGSDGERTSPVERGAWVMRKLINDPPPPAPANVPQLSRFDDQPLNSRQLQTAHMEEPQCAQCHRKIDPIGFGLENFNAAGLWRETETIGKLRGIGVYAKGAVEHKIDPSGSLPDGTPFDDFFEMRDRIAEREDDFAQGFTEALIAYGLGRPYGFTDQDLADQILQHSRRDDYNTRAFIHALVQSKAFQRK